MVKKKTFLQRLINRNFGKTAGDRTFHAFNYLFFALIAIIMIYPFIYVLVKSLTVYKIGADGIPIETFSFAAYQYFIHEKATMMALIRTFIIMFFKVLIALLVTFLMAYPLSKKYLKGRTAISMFMLITMYVSGGVIPTFILIRQTFHWTNNYLTYIIPSCVAAYNVFVVKAFLQNIPESLEEAAIIDGANSFEVFFKIYVPLSGPIVATIGLWEGVALWNNWTTGLYYFTDTSKYVFVSKLRALLSEMSSSASGDGGNQSILAMTENKKMAMIVLGILPILLVYPFVQKYFVKGMLVGSVKG